MGNIVLLDDLTINKIAAGEVIERPASVVKEMVENSIDAGADRITIEIEKGGISLIRITDNGCGIQGDDLEIAFERHATSKIREANDLATVRTMGFRGEALASVAAISYIEVISRSEKEEIGHRIVIEGGNVLEKEEIAAPIGTSITVKNLFYNTPVRYKFLKKDYTEAGYIEDIITRLALVHQEIAFKLMNSGKRLIQTPGKGADNKSIIYSIYGKDIAASVVDVSYEYEGIKVTGVIGKPEIARSNRSNQLFFVNQRYIKDKNLTAAAEQAFKGLIPIGKFGFLILNLDMDPEKVDVNVHPAKLEVRFVEESKVFKSVYHAIKDSLLKSELVEDVDREKQEWKKEGKSVGFMGRRKEVEQEEANPLKDVYEFRKGLKQIGVSPIATASMNANVMTQFEHKDEMTSQKEPVAAMETVVATVEKKIENSSLDDFDYNKYSKEELEKKVNDYIMQYRHAKKARIEANDEIANDYSGQVIEGNGSQSEGMKTSNTSGLETNENETQEDTTVQLNGEKIDNQLPNQEIVSLPNNQSQENQETAKLEEVNSIIEGILQNINNQFKMAEGATEAKEVKNELENNGQIEETKNQDQTDIKTRIEDTQVLNIEENNGEDLKIEEGSLLQGSNSFDEKKQDDTIQTAVSKEKQDQTIQMSTSEQENENYTASYVNAAYHEADTRAIVEKLVREKLNSKQDTQIIDTEQVRAALRQNDFHEMYQKTFGKSPMQYTEKNQELEEKQKNLNMFESEESYIPEIKYKFIGIVFKTYIIIEVNDEMYIIDQHAAHERIMYEKVKENYYSTEEKDSQLMLIPDVITLTHKDAMKVKENLEMFEKAGFMLEEFGENTIKLTGVPERCMEMNTKQLFLDILDEIDTTNYTARKEIEEKFIATVACKSAVKARMVLDEKEVESLMKKLLALPNPFTCPHGRPTAIKMTKKEIEKKFSRRK